jgi:hypothetical protein
LVSNCLRERKADLFLVIEDAASDLFIPKGFYLRPNTTRKRAYAIRKQQPLFYPIPDKGEVDPQPGQLGAMIR